jgi:hypothetical protein
MKTIKNLMFAAIAGILLSQTSVVRAADDHSDAIITWTKHVTEFLPPGGDIFATFEGPAGGDLGEGTIIGDAFNPREVLPNGSATFEAEYRFTGSKHSLTVLFRIVQGVDQNGVIRGVMTGVVTDGWLKGNVGEGHYTGYACEQGVNHLCFDGVFIIKKGSKHQD